MALCILSQWRPKITWYKVSPSIKCIRVRALLDPTLKSKDTCLKVNYYNNPILAQVILSCGMPLSNDSFLWRDEILVEASVSTKVLLIWKALKKVVTYKGLSPSTTRLTKSLTKKATYSLVSWYATCNKLPSEVATPWLLSLIQVKACVASFLANGLRPTTLRKEWNLSCKGEGAKLLTIFSASSSIGSSQPMKMS